MGAPRVRLNHGEICRLYAEGVTYREIARRMGVSYKQLENYIYRQSKNEGKPRPARARAVTHEVYSRALTKRRARNVVKPGIIIDLMDEYLEENGMTVMDFCRKVLKEPPASRARYLYKCRSGEKKYIHVDVAAKILRAIGEPVPSSLKNRKAIRRDMAA